MTGSTDLAQHPPAPSSLDQLLVESGSGLEESFEELHRRTRERVHAVALRIVRSSELAREVTQETYLEVWQQADRYRADRASVMGWITMIARRRAIDRVRSVSRALGREQRYTRGAPGVVEDDHAERVVDRLEAARLHPLLAALSPLQREALTLVYLQRQSPQEAATLLGAPLSTLKTRLRDGLQQLRQRLPDAPGGTLTSGSHW
ncbi:sigma-70 family RNA polymerase sigma factor [uncultured Friedmanniella sp.]|uniref:sigma-70 family RNA polymerase sigma factor n=1 Tax=uncultured Friedmanniella sp. TaxID=335381 RepID=UPI0035CAA92A